MPRYSGYLIKFDEEQRADWLREVQEWRGTFSDALSARDWGFKEYEVCLLSFDGSSIEVACLGRRGKSVATAKYRVEFSTFVPLRPLPFEEIERLIGPRFRSHFIRSTTGRGQRVPPETWLELVKVVKEARPESAEAINNLIRLQEASKREFRGPAAETVALERDAVGVALDIFDRSKELRKRSLSRWSPPPDTLAPFMEGVDAVRLTEEQMLAHDSNVFSDAAAGTPTVYGRRFAIGDRLLDVVYQNRTAVERTLGVDLIYYNHTFDAYTLVQYKRMTEEAKVLGKPRTVVFRPNSDSNFAAELGRMNAFRERTPDNWQPPKEWHAYRLNGDGFFFKFCPAITLELLTADLIKGMYLPREYLESLLASSITDGQRGGKLVAFENVKRHLSNTEFTTMVQQGWVGTRGVSTTEITEIVRDALASGRAVIQAWSSSEDVEADE